MGAHLVVVAECNCPLAAEIRGNNNKREGTTTPRISNPSPAQLENHPPRNWVDATRGDPKIKGFARSRIKPRKPGVSHFARRGCAGAARSPAAAPAHASRSAATPARQRGQPGAQIGNGGIELIWPMLLAACHTRARRKAREVPRPAVCAMPLEKHGVPPPSASVFMAVGAVGVLARARALDSFAVQKQD